MSVEYNDFAHLIFQNVDARQYYNELPCHIREQIDSNSSNILSFKGLKDYAESLIK